MSETTLTLKDVTVVALHKEIESMSKYKDVILMLDDHITCRRVDGDVPFEKIDIKACDYCTLDRQSTLLRPSSSDASYFFSFANEADCTIFAHVIDEAKAGVVRKPSAFQQRTDEVSASQYFQFYGLLTQQQNMMQDYIRTSTYQRAVHANAVDFANKIILDVGAGTGLLSFFAMQVNAKRVYAVEASSMATYCKTLVDGNKCSGEVIVVPGMVEDINLPEMVDAIISEPMGYMLINERMLESYVHARKFLKPGGKMFPSVAYLHFSPFSDETLFLETCAKANFWAQESFHGINLSMLRDQALTEYFGQPIVDTFHSNILMAPSQKWTIDFTTCSEEMFHRIEIPYDFVLRRTGFIHGLAFWFEVAFEGSREVLWLSTAPSEPLTHWYQIRCQIGAPIFGNEDSHCTGTLLFIANRRLSYDVVVTMTCEGQSSINRLDLKNAFFRYNGQPVQPPPGFHTVSPTEQHLNPTIGNEPQATCVNGTALFDNGAPSDEDACAVVKNRAPVQGTLTSESNNGALDDTQVNANYTANYDCAEYDYGVGTMESMGAGGSPVTPNTALSVNKTPCEYN